MTLVTGNDSQVLVRKRSWKQEGREKGHILNASAVRSSTKTGSCKTQSIEILTTPLEFSSKQASIIQEKAALSSITRGFQPTTTGADGVLRCVLAPSPYPPGRMLKNAFRYSAAPCGLDHHNPLTNRFPGRVMHFYVRCRHRALKQHGSCHTAYGNPSCWFSTARLPVDCSLVYTHGSEGKKRS